MDPAKTDLEVAKQLLAAAHRHVVSMHTDLADQEQQLAGVVVRLREFALLLQHEWELMDTADPVSRRAVQAAIDDHTVAANALTAEYRAIAHRLAHRFTG